MSDRPLFTDDCYGSVLEVAPIGAPLDDWLGIEVTFTDGVPGEYRHAFNALPPEQIEALRDALTAWLDEHPVRPDPLANGAEVECEIGGETFYVSRMGDVTA